MQHSSNALSRAPAATSTQCALVVVAHPDPQSLTHQLARAVAAGVTAAGHGAEIADLAAEGFDPRFTADDLAHFRGRAAMPAAICTEQARIDRAQALVLVYPVYWWSMPGLLKGWVDRVFVNGWAYDELPDGGLAKHLGRLQVHLLGLGAADRDTYARRGYAQAMGTQIDHGIFNYVGAPVATSQLLLPSDAGFPGAALASARALGEQLFGLGDNPGK